MRCIAIIDTIPIIAEVVYPLRLGFRVQGSAVGENARYSYIAYMKHNIVLHLLRLKYFDHAGFSLLAVSRKNGFV